MGLTWGGSLWLVIGLSVLCSCLPEMPVTSSISIQVDGLSKPVNADLYGLTIEEINHGIEGGLYAELIQNRSFEDGVPPLNCPYDASRNVLITPNGWTIPFIPRDSIPGWRRVAPNTRIWLDTQERINEKNLRSLGVAVSTSAVQGTGGVVAEGYHRVSIRKGERYRFSFFAKGAYTQPRSIRVALMDSVASVAYSDVFEVAPVSEWKRYQHTFTATDDIRDAVLAMTTDTSQMFWIDVVSLMPEKTWKGRENGVRADLAALIDSLSPRFIRFPGGSFVEGYTAGTYPVWRETVGDISERKHFWNVWGYGTSNGMGFHEYLQLCEDLNAEPVYVLNSGVTSQSRRPRYENITAMGRLVDEALAAIAYANAPVDSALGAMRARNGHPDPFHLRYVEIGSENYGTEYARRFRLFQETLREVYPEVKLIGSSDVPRRDWDVWVDSHYYAGEYFFLSNSKRFSDERYSWRSPALFIGELGMVERPLSGTLRAAVAEACFLIGAEKNPDRVRRLAYAPVLGNKDFACVREPLISFDADRAVVSPSYYLWKMFARHRGDELLSMRMETYQRPRIYAGRAGIEMFDNSFEFKEVRVDRVPVSEIAVLRGGWKVKECGVLVPDANRWNHVLFGDSTKYDCDYTAWIRRTKGSGQIQLRLRDNGLPGEQADYIGMTIGRGVCELYHQSMGVRDSLASAVSFPFESGRWYKVRMTCERERVRCYVDDVLLHEVELRPIPSLVSVATLDKEKRKVYVKVVNTTAHEERTALFVEGAAVRNEVGVLQLTGDPEARNTFESPDAVVPVARTVVFPENDPFIYKFPPYSVTILEFTCSE